MSIGRIHHIAIKASDLVQAKEFYTETLGFPIVARIPNTETVFIDIGGTTIELSAGKPNEVAACSCGLIHLAFEVPDVDATYAELVTKGIQFHITPRNFGDIRLAFFRGPDGVELELFNSPTITWK
ncbi:MAG: VOC family protein [Anaerolineae bacterium]